MSGNPLDDLLPIRRIYVDGGAKPFVRDLNVDTTTGLMADIDVGAGVLTLGLSFARTSAKAVDPRSSAPAGDIMAAQAAGYHVELSGDAIYSLEGPIDLRTGLELKCMNSRAIMRPNASFAPLSSLADSDANYVIGAQATRVLLAGVTLQRDARQRIRNIRINYQPSANQWLLIRSTASATVYYVYNADVIGYELVRVKSVSADLGGGVYDCTLYWDLQQSHASGSTIYNVTSHMEDVLVSGLWLDFVGKNHAVGIIGSAVNRLTIDNCDLGGFTRAQIHIKDGCVEPRVSARTRLDTNCFLRLQSSSGRYELDTVQGGGRTHGTYGIVRGLVTMRHNCSFVDLRGLLAGASCGISMWGGTSNNFDVEIRDMDFTLRAASDAELVQNGLEKVGGAGLDFGSFSSPSNWGEFQLGTTVKARLVDCGGTNVGAGFAYPSGHFVDLYGLKFDLDIINTGASSTYENAAPDSAKQIAGALFYDCFNARGSIRAHGVDAPLWLDGNTNSIRIDHLEAWPADAETFVTASLIRIGQNGGTGRVSIGVAIVGTNDGYPFTTGYATPTAGTFEGITIDKLMIQNIGFEWDNCFFAYQTESTLVTQGQRMELFSTTISSVAHRGLRDPSTTGEIDKVYAVMGHGQYAGIAQNTWGLVARGPNLSIRTSTTPGYGDVMTAGAGRDLAIGTPASTPVCGQIESLKTNGLCRMSKASGT